MSDQPNGPQSSAGDSTKSHVEKWLEEKGIGLELAVAAEFRRPLGQRRVEHARFYLADQDDRPKLREVDVTADCPNLGASTARGFVLTSFVVECKSAKHAPWVLYRSGDTLLRFVGQSELGLVKNAFRVVERGSSVDRLTGWSVSDAHRSVYGEGQYAYQIADTGEDTSRDNPRQSAYQAVRQVVSAVDGLAAEVPTDPSFLLSIFVPVVVTAAPLFTVDADGDSYSVASASIVPLLGRFTMTDRLSLIWIVQEKAVSEYVTSAIKGAIKLDLSDANVYGT